MKQKPLQWHPAFQSVLQIELQEDLDILEFSHEHTLTKKPLQIDTLLIKCSEERRVKASIGHLFRRYNIVEYKNPTDYFSVNDFYKVIAYASLLQSDTERVLEIPPEQITITVVTNHYPRTVIRHLVKHCSTAIRQPYSGIFYADNLLFPVQFIINGKLPEQEYAWLSRLRTDLEIEKDITPLARLYQGKENSPMYSSAMDLIIHANWAVYEEGQKMCDALRELFAEELEENRREGVEIGKRQGIETGIQALIEFSQEMMTEQALVLTKLMEKFSLSQNAAELYLAKYWK